ncbi:DUF2339 domain-containing protein [Croceicoccus ponticola]|uniref:DUF2339 domain-containing protein n=1 Tax=Croceicoccus ponticola TaxID=2217664 RepID=A0A437GXM1_9SPHN|nr:DUF2339 domain-containing protein [Croceicoccus ponticola]RVQ65986.1 DUF2339 domain-containing protein [Croceicoccus ponticola]
MEWIVIVALAVAVYRLWRRVEQLESRIALHDDRAAVPLSERREVVPEKAADQAVVAPLAEPPAAVPRRAIARIAGMGRTAPSSATPETAVREGRSFSFNFEDLFGRQLPIWAGGITLAIAGFFLVVYAIDLGLLSPFVRVLLGFAFGGVLLNGAFFAERMHDRIRDPRVPQALAGAGLATLYACFYLAGEAYGLIAGGVAFVGLAAVTTGAIWCSFRFGLPCAVLGLVGGFAAPAMVSADHANLPILSIYLALISAGLTLTGNRQERPWLGVAALAGALLWGIAMLFTRSLDPFDQLFIGAYLVAIGVVLPVTLADLPYRRWIRAGAGAFAAVQMAALVGNGGFDLLAWGLYALLAAALAVIGWRNRDLREVGAFAAAVALAMLLAWSDPTERNFALVGAALTAIFAGVALVHVWRGTARDSDFVQLGGFAFGVAFAAVWHFGGLFGASRPMVALACVALTLFPAVAAWRLGEAKARWQVHWLEALAAMTVFLASAQVLDDRWAAIACAVAAIMLAIFLPRRVAAARTFAALAAIFALYPLAEWWEAGLGALGADPFYKSDLASPTDTLRYLAPVVAAGLALVWRQAGIASRKSIRGIGAMAGIGAVVLAHSLYKLVFAISGAEGFEALGLAERTVWQALLLGAGVLIWMLRDRYGAARVVAIALAGASLAHFGWFTLMLHNPLWADQAVGPVPVANLALAAYAVAAAGLVFGSRIFPARARIGFEIAIMALLPMLAVTLLRQAFSGSILTAQPMRQGEDLLRSLSGIVLAIAYLVWGARREDRAWRIGSLVLMLLAVGKVFLVDAAVLDGLARIASFLALGFSLIGIGWFYSRILARPAAAVPPPT